MVPGSGTVGGGGGGGGGGLQLLFVVTVQPPEVGVVGAPIGRGTKPLGGPPPPAKLPPAEGPIGIPGSTLSRLEPGLDGNASIPLATASGRSSSASSGSSGEVFAWGRTDT